MKVDTKNPYYVILYAGVVSAIFTFAIMSLNAVSQPIVERNKKLATDKAFVELFELGDVEKLSPNEIVELRSKYVHKGPTVELFGKIPAVTQTWVVRKNGKVLAVAIPVRGVGFWAPISGYIALSPDLNTVKGVVFLGHSETPGLGGRLTEKNWRDKFKGLKIDQAGTDDYKLIYIDNNPSPSKQNRHVDAITGATGTSSAIEKFINNSLLDFRNALGDNPAQQLAKLIALQQEGEK